MASQGLSPRCPLRVPDVSPTPVCVPNPAVCPPQLRNLITDVSQHKLLVFAGPCVEDTGELMLQTGCFSLRDFIQIFTDKEVWRGGSCGEEPGVGFCRVGGGG